MTRCTTASARFGILFLLTIVLLAPPIGPVHAGTVHRYVEDFSTEQYKDSAATTTDWNTAAARLRLFPFLPDTVARFDPPGPGFSRDLAVDGNILCLVDGSEGLRVFDVTDPRDPVLSGTWVSLPDGIEAFASDVVIDGDRALVADGLSGIQIIDITNPAVPVRIGHFQTPAFARGLAVAGDRVYVAQSDLPPFTNSGLLVIDISDPTAPTLAASLILTGLPMDVLPIGVTLDGDLAYVAGGKGGLYVVDITDPANPTQIGKLPTPNLSRSVAIADRYAYMATAQSGLFVVDVSNPLSPTLAKVFDTPGISFGVALAGDALYVADGTTGVLEFDVSDPLNPVLDHTVDTPGDAIGVTVAGGYAYVSDGAAGLEVIKISDVVPPLLVATTQSAMSAAGVTIKGNHALVADGSFGMRSVDITDPTSPVVVGGAAAVFALSGALSVSGDYLYASTGGSQQLEIFLISDPASPSRLANFGTGGETGRMVIRGDIGYMGNGVLGFTVLNLASPAVPSIAGNTSTPNFAVAADVAGDHALVTVIATGVQAVDVSNPAMPVTVGSHFDGTGGNDIELHGDQAFVAAGDGLRIFGIGDPSSPSLLAGPVSIPGVGRGLAVAGDYVVLASGSNPPGGVTVIDVTDPAQPRQVGSVLTTNSLDVAIAGDLAYVADWTSGLRIFQVFQRSFDLTLNEARSTNVHAAADTIVRVRLTTVQNDSIRWEITADGGVTWGGIVPGGDWVRPVQSGADLRWRSVHSYTNAFTNPSAAGLELEWLYPFAAIDSIVDVPNDAGGQVNVFFSRSGHDFADTLLVGDYAVRRRVDGALPPDDWQVVGTVIAQQQDRYIVMVPTVPDTADTVHSVYSIRARTADSLVFWDSPPDSGFSVDNTVAVLISSFAAVYMDNTVRLVWQIGQADLLQGFHVYRSRHRDDGYRRINPTMLPGGEHAYIDTDIDRGVSYWYRLGAVDRDGEFQSAPVAVVVPGARFHLFQNHPNPFNPSTTISYEVPVSARVTLRIFDVAGRLVRTLIDERQPPGRKSAVWDGRDAGGRPVASGIYFYRLRAPGFRETRKMALLE